MARVDPDHLIAATLDLARNSRSNLHEINRMAARLARLSNVAAPDTRRLFQTAYRQVLEDHLNQLVPAAWGCTEIAARREIARAFLPELRAGACLRATGAGLVLCDRSAT